MMSLKSEQKWCGAILAALALTGTGSPARAADDGLRAALRELAAKIEALQIEQKRMQSKLDAAERALATAKTPAPAASAQAVTGGDVPGSFKLPGSNTSVLLGGYVKGVGIYNQRSAVGAGTGFNTADELLAPNAVPLSNAAVRQRTWKAHAKESRLFAKTYSPSAYGPITTYFEIDFQGTSGTEFATNSHNPRIRHAWATIGHLGVGHTWSNALNLTVIPENLDTSPNISLFADLRQGQVRWTQPLKNGYWSVSAENPESAIVLNSAGTGANTFPDNDKSPDFTGKYHFAAGGGEYELAAMVARKRTAPGAAEASMTASGVGFSGYIPTFGSDRLLFGINASRNMGRHLGGYAQDAIVVGTNLVGLDTKAAFLAYKHFWTPTWRSNLNFGWININNPAGLSAATAAAMNKHLRVTHLNLIWAARRDVDLGVELLHASREVESGLDGAINRVTFMGKYSF